MIHQEVAARRTVLDEDLVCILSEVPGINICTMTVPSRAIEAIRCIRLGGSHGSGVPESTPAGFYVCFEPVSGVGFKIVKKTLADP